ncbi:acyl-CoA dehydrogenase family protein [Sporichthya brevicatena]|uniref:Acyl-CoA dehydrogenase family protein n=1 Tax=Sporichthya brevicatena TaxID=171442 RepID=A0ABN1GQW4_9ACTN
MPAVEGENEDRTALREAVRDVLADHASPEQVRAALDAGPSEALWSALVKVGLPTLHVGEELGGQGGSPGDLAAALEECGVALAPSPLLSVGVAVSLLAATGAPSVPALLADAAAGSVVTVALAEGSAGWLAAPGTSAVPAGDGWELTGVKCYVTDPVGARLVVSATTPDGPGLFVVEPGVATVEVHGGLDLLRPVGTVTLSSAPATLLLEGVPAAEALLTWSRTAAVLLAAEQVGLAQACLDLAVEYAKVRVQFGKPIGSFQAIKHLCADMLLAVEGSRSLLWSATGILDDGRGADPTDDEAELVCATTAGHCADAAVTVAQDCLQVHGGIGFTWEHVCHLYLRRAKADEVLFGSPSYWRERAVSVLERQVAAAAS